MPTNQQTPKGIWKKLFTIQKDIKTFNVTDESDKTDPKTGKSAYTYTPGWKISETIREHMDRMGLMLIPNYSFNRIDEIEYPVYKMIENTPTSFRKKEVHVSVNADFTWMDTETGETAGPFHIIAAGANGTDKSTASAMAMAERYFYLKFFHISTHEKDDEPDAHDSDNIPGIPRTIQGGLRPQDACRAVPVQQGYQPQPAYGPQPQMPQVPYNPGAGTYRRQDAPVQQPPIQGGAQVNIYPPAPTYIAPAPQRDAQAAAPFNDKEANVAAAIRTLSNFDRGTLSHQQILNELLGKLTAAGIDCTGKNFIENLSEGAQACRESRLPRYI